MGLSCGNPTAIAGIKTGEVVLDLGCGGGMDVFLAAQKVGPSGRVIGVDMTEKMVELARQNAIKRGTTNVEFYLAEIENMTPVKDHTVDCVISNCVINLVPNKAKAMDEIYRVLKPGGRVALSDIALRKPLPEEIKNDIIAYTGCIGGAVLIEQYKSYLENAGFKHNAVVPDTCDLNAYRELGTGSGGGCCGGQKSCDATSPSFKQDMVTLTDSCDLNEFAASVKVYAVKP